MDLNLFRAMMYGGLQESHQAEVEIKDANLIAFKALLKYIYKGYIALQPEKVANSSLFSYIIINSTSFIYWYLR